MGDVFDVARVRGIAGADSNGPLFAGLLERLCRLQRHAGPIRGCEWCVVLLRAGSAQLIAALLVSR